MNQREQGKAFFAVKRRSQNAKVAPTLVAIVESYDDAVSLADRRNEQIRTQNVFYPTLHHG